MTNSYCILTKNLTSADVKFFAKEIGISIATAKKKCKTHGAIEFFWYKQANKFVIRFVSLIRTKYGIIVSATQYSDIKYNLCVETID